jgi:hypothetical protein
MDFLLPLLLIITTALCLFLLDIILDLSVEIKPWAKQILLALCPVHDYT